MAETHCMHLRDTGGPGQFLCSMIETEESFAAAQSTKLQSRGNNNCEHIENVCERVDEKQNQSDPWMGLVLDKSLESVVREPLPGTSPERPKFHETMWIVDTPGGRESRAESPRQRCTSLIASRPFGKIIPLHLGIPLSLGRQMCDTVLNMG